MILIEEFPNEVTRDTNIYFPKMVLGNITVVYGDSGSGKTTLLKNIEKVFKHLLLKPVRAACLDWTFLRDYLKNLKPDEKLHIPYQVASVFIKDINLREDEIIIKFQNRREVELCDLSSSQEAIIFIVTRIATMKHSSDCHYLILVDDPESFLSEKQQREVADFLKMVSKDHQVLVMTKSPVFVTEFENDETYLLTRKGRKLRCFRFKYETGGVTPDYFLGLLDTPLRNKKVQEVLTEISSIITTESDINSSEKFIELLYRKLEGKIGSSDPFMIRLNNHVVK